MRTLIETLAGLAILVNAVIYGTDVFGAIVQRPAIAAVDDRTLTQALGHIHRVADRRLKVVTSKPVNTALTAAAVTDQVPDDARQLQARWDSVIDGGVALQTLALAALCVALASA
jgi:hypothetical protein